jgi:hypothetical protein
MREIKELLEFYKIKYAKMEHYQNRIIVRTPSLPLPIHRLIAGSTENIYEVEEPIFVKIDLTWWEKLYMMITRQKFWYKDYR